MQSQLQATIMGLEDKERSVREDLGAPLGWGKNKHRPC